MNLALIAGVSALLVLLLVMRRNTADGGASPKAAKPPKPAKAPKAAKPAKERTAKAVKAPREGRASRSAGRERPQRGWRGRRRGREDGPPAPPEPMPLTASTEPVTASVPPAEAALADQETTEFALPTEPAADEPDWDAMRAAMNGTDESSVAAEPILAAAREPEPQVWDEGDLITEPGWPQPGDMDGGWEEHTADAADLTGAAPEVAESGAGSAWLGTPAAATTPEPVAEGAAEPEVEATWVEDPATSWNAGPAVAADEPEPVIGGWNPDEPVEEPAPWAATDTPAIAEEPEVTIGGWNPGEPVEEPAPWAATDAPAVAEEAMPWTAAETAPVDESTGWDATAPDPSTPWSAPEPADETVPETGDWAQPDTDWGAPAQEPAGWQADPADSDDWSWGGAETETREPVGAATAEVAATAGPVAEPPAPAFDADEWAAFARAAEEAQASQEVPPADPEVPPAFDAEVWGAPAAQTVPVIGGWDSDEVSPWTLSSEAEPALPAEPVAAIPVPAAEPVADAVTEPVAETVTEPVTEPLTVAEPAHAVEPVAGEAPQVVVTDGPAWWDEAVDDDAEIVLDQLPDWLQAPADELLTGRWSLGGMALQPGHQALVGVTFRQPLDSAPTDWTLPTRGRPAAGTVVLVVEALMNCEAEGIQVLTEDGFAPSPEGFTMRLTAGATGPFAASGTFRVVTE